MARREDGAVDAAPGDDQDGDSSFVPTAREVIARREILFDALDE